MGVAVDAEETAGGQRIMSHLGVEVEARRVGIDLESHPVLGRGGEDARPVKVPAWPAIDQASARVGDDVDVGVGDRSIRRSVRVARSRPNPECSEATTMSSEARVSSS
jgi:hypothetical protein